MIRNSGKIAMTLTACLLVCVAAYGQKIAPLPGERWWGAMTALGSAMPYAADTRMYDLRNENFNNQISPLLLSSLGRYVWCDEPFRYGFSGDTLVIEDAGAPVEIRKSGSTLRSARRDASKRHFPAGRRMPPDEFFSCPQYNTWIELMYDQNQKDILAYAHSIVGKGFPTGILMIDDNWQEYYGNFDFKGEKFPDAIAMCSELHALGFRIMLWICPFINFDTPAYEETAAAGYLLKDASTGAPAAVNWWNGSSACIDLTNPAAVEWFKARLRDCMYYYGVDGFKFDAGDIDYMGGNYAWCDPSADKHDFSRLWAEMALDFPYNELRTVWKGGNLPLVQRLGDKDYSWRAVSALIPDMISAGLLGYTFTCPDMIGGGAFSTFLNVKPGEFDEELIVRSCQIHALMPMMQFSVAPWRILSPENCELCAGFARLHRQFGPYILDCARKSALKGEPIVRSLEYQYPSCGYEEIKDEYLLGEDVLVAPMTFSGSSRMVVLPEGRWEDDRGRVFTGPARFVTDVPLERLPYYRRK